MGGVAGQRLADSLKELKQRSGLSYEELARRTFSTRSTLHRYCTGTTVPADYGIVAAIAKECGASPAELNALLEYWTAAGNATTYTPKPTVDAPRPRRVLFALVCVGLLVLLGGQDLGRRPAVASGPGDRWTFAPWPVDPASFGVTMNSNTGTMPSFRVGSVRFWDSGTRWADLEPRRGQFDWATLDGMVAAARRAGKPVLFTIGGTPGWAAPDGKKSLYADGSRTAPPDDLADWDAFVRALARRYQGMDAYELWDTVNDPHFFSGTPGTLVEMVRRASRIIRHEDPRATVVCPSVGHLREAAGLAFMRRFARLGGYEPCDVAGLKMRQRPAQEPPETMAAELAAVDRTLHAAGVGMPLWDTGPDYDVRGQPTVRGARARDYAVRFYLMGLYGRDLHLDRTYFYDWGGVRIPIVLQVEGEAPTAAARAVDRIQRWLDGARIRGCGHGAAAGLPGNVWQCRFLRGGRDMVIRWAAVGAATVPAGPGAGAVHRLDGTSSRVTPGAPVRITGAPVLID